MESAVILKQIHPSKRVSVFTVGTRRALVGVVGALELHCSYMKCNHCHFVRHVN